LNSNVYLSLCSPGRTWYLSIGSHGNRDSWLQIAKKFKFKFGATENQSDWSQRSPLTISGHRKSIPQPWFYHSQKWKISETHGIIPAGNSQFFAKSKNGFRSARRPNWGKPLYGEDATM
jgi:hypothetical protein